MTKEATEEAIRRAIEKHITENKAIVCNPDGLVVLIMTELGFTDLFHYNGWTIRRKVGKSIKGTARGSQHAYGYVATKPKRPEEIAAPSGGVDVPLDYFKLMLDRIDERCED